MTPLGTQCGRTDRLTPRDAIAGNDQILKSSILRVLAISHHTGVTIAEIAFLLIMFSGIWLVAAQLRVFKWKTARTIVAGFALACAGALLIIATHWGHFG